MSRKSDLYRLYAGIKERRASATVLKRLKKYITASVSGASDMELKLFKHLSDLRHPSRFNTAKACEFLSLEEAKVYRIQRKLLERIEQFLIIEHIQDSKNLKQQLLLEVYKDFDMPERFGTILKLKKDAYDADYLHQQYQIALTEYNYLDRSHREGKPPSLKEAMQHFDYYRQAEAFKQAYMELSRFPDDKTIIERLISDTKVVANNEDNYIENAPIVYLYYLAYLLSIPSNEIPIPKIVTAYSFLESFLLGTANCPISKEDFKGTIKIELFDILKNFCATQINQKRDYWDKMGILLSKGAEEGYLNKMTHHTFINNIMVFAKLQVFEDMRSFIDNAMQKKFLLEQEGRTRILDLADGLYYHYKSEDKKASEKQREKDRNKSIPILLGVKQGDAIQEVSIKLALIKMEIRNEEWINALKYQQQLSDFLTVNNLPRYQLTLDYLKQIIHLLELISNLKERRKLAEIIANEVRSITLKGWMVEVLKE